MSVEKSLDQGLRRSVSWFCLQKGNINMKFRAVVKKSGAWWIGWLVDLPGVNAQEKTREKLMESLKIGAEDMLMTPVEAGEEEELVAIELE